MNCPKCGSNLVKQVDQQSKKETGYWFCEKHRDLYTTKEVNEFYFYNRRLDKVLEKFKKYDKGLYYKLTIYLEINYNKNKFYLVLLDEGTWVDYNEISLATVEHLIKDMEAQDE